MSVAFCARGPFLSLPPPGGILVEVFTPLNGETAYLINRALVAE